MIKLFSTQPYQERVDMIYKQLERNPWCDLKYFEKLLRKISILNAKIKNLSADMGKQEGVYDTL